MSCLMGGWLLDLGFQSGIRTHYIDGKGFILELEFNKKVIQLSQAITNQMTKSLVPALACEQGSSVDWYYWLVFDRYKCLGVDRHFIRQALTT